MDCLWYLRWVYHHYCAMLMAVVALTWDIKGYYPHCQQKQVNSWKILFCFYFCYFCVICWLICLFNWVNLDRMGSSFSWYGQLCKVWPCCFKIDIKGNGYILGLLLGRYFSYYSFLRLPILYIFHIQIYMRICIKLLNECSHPHRASIIMMIYKHEENL